MRAVSLLASLPLLACSTGKLRPSEAMVMATVTATGPRLTLRPIRLTPPFLLMRRPPMAPRRIAHGVGVAEWLARRSPGTVAEAGKTSVAVIVASACIGLNARASDRSTVIPG